MSEKLTIRNFGPIKNVELDFKKFNVIIGENATGKSTVAKVLAVCRYFSFIVKTQYGILDNFLENDDGEHFLEGLRLWGMQEFLKDNSEIYYSNKDYSITVKFKFQDKKFKEDVQGPYIFQDVETRLILHPISDSFKKLLEEFKNLKPDEPYLNAWHLPTSFFQNEVANVMNNPFFISTERGLQSIFSLGKNSIPNISDSLFNQLANLDLIAKNFKFETKIEPFNIEYKNVDGRGYIKKDGKHDFISLVNAASGYKTAIPIVLSMKYYSETRKKQKTFILEEPELNLFPEAQKSLINYLVENTSKYKNDYLLTTHSPYILTSLNNLVYAYKLGQNYSESVDKIIEKKYWLNPADISAYQLLPDGSFKDILAEDGLIMAEKIDSISGILNEQFDELLNIEFVRK